jgi:hypothetical protein
MTVAVVLLGGRSLQTGTGGAVVTTVVALFATTTHLPSSLIA